MTKGTEIASNLRGCQIISGRDVERVAKQIDAAFEELPEKLAYSLWETSKLRHGLFTPVEFREICRNVIRDYLSNNQVTHGEAVGSTDC